MSDWTWELRHSDGGMLGTPFALGLMAAAPVVLAHALPDSLSVVVREGDRVVARGERLTATAATPMARLVVEGEAVRREDVWPDASDVGRPVVLPGGEVGILKDWWHADDRSAWRWLLELSNAR